MIPPKESVSNNFVAAHRLVAALEPFVVVTDFNAGRLDFSPFGVTVPTAHRIDPTRTENATFLHLLQTLDARTFGPEGMPMDRWVFYDCCFMPGAIFGFGRRASELSPRAREVLKVPTDYRGLVPYSMYIAIPVHARHPDTWMGHNLASMAPVLPEEDLGGLGTLTKALGLKAFCAAHFLGATQWASLALYIHSKVGPLALHTAYTPAHSDARTLTYGFEVNDAGLLGSLGAPGYSRARPAPDFWVDATDVDAMIALQTRIEAGERFVIPGRPKRGDGAICVPVSALKA